MGRSRQYSVGGDRRLDQIDPPVSRNERRQLRGTGEGAGRPLERDDDKLEAVFRSVLERGTGGMFTFAGDRVVRMGGD